MNKKVLGLLLFVVASIRGAGLGTPSFTLINGVVKDETEAELRPLSVMVAYESRESIKLTGHTVKTCQIPIPLAEAGKIITRIHITEYNTHLVPMAQGLYEFTTEIRSVLSSGDKCLLVTRGSAKHKHDHKLVFSIEDLKKLQKATKSEVCVIQ